MSVRLEPITPADREPVVDIFNYYIENSFAAYPEHKVPYNFFDMLLKMCQGYPAVAAKEDNGEIVGFCMLRPYSPISTFSKTAEITYFIKPDFRGKGIGTSMLNYLVEEARQRNITSILASISSRNEASITFHSKNGFEEVGCLRNIGSKNEESFDVVWMQKML